MSPSSHDDYSFETAPQWMQDADKRTMVDSIESILFAFNQLEGIVQPIIDSGADLLLFDPGFDTYALMSTHCTTIYNECSYLVKEHHGGLRKEDLLYLRHLRNLCAHRFGRSMSTAGFLDSVAYVILPMKGAVRSMLLDILKKDGKRGNDLYGQVRSMNRRRARGGFINKLLGRCRCHPVAGRCVVGWTRSFPGMVRFIYDRGPCVESL